MMRTLEKLLWLPGNDPDALLLPQLDEVAKGEPVVVYRSLQERDFRNDVRRAWWRQERGALNLPFGPFGLQYPITSLNWPQFTGAVAPTPVAVTPTTLGTTTGRCWPFILPGSTQVSKIYLHSPNAVATSFQFGLFSFSGVQKYASGTQGTSANATTISPTAFKMTGGLMNYAVLTNANLTSATTAYFFTAPFASAFLPRWGTVAVTAGAMPASITPSSSITATVGGWPIMVIGVV